LCILENRFDYVQLQSYLKELLAKNVSRRAAKNAVMRYAENLQTPNLTRCINASL
jgi:hypothetical protein